MIKLSKKIEYGLISLLHINNINNLHLVTCREISDHYHIPHEILGKVLQGLAKAKLIESIQGVKGGYHLSKDLEHITLGEVIEALEGPLHITPCTCDDYICHIEPQCNIQGPIFHFQDQLLKFIYNVSLKSFQKKDNLYNNDVEKVQQQ